MIIITTPSETRSEPGASAGQKGGRRAGFTLAEVMIGASLGTIVLAGIMSTFLMLGRSGVNAANYSQAETEIRRALERFGQDVRMARGVTWNSSTSITLRVPNSYASTSNEVTYAFDPATTGATAGCFYMVPGRESSSATRTVLVRNISRFEFLRWNRADTAAAKSDAETKRLQIDMNVRHTNRTTVAANTSVVSVSYLLRNKGP